MCLHQRQQDKIVAVALSWIGTPYHHKARVKGAGVDCGQILAAVYEEAGIIPAYDPGNYPRDWHLHRSEEQYLGHIERFAGKIPDGEAPLPGDIALFRFGRCISHGAIVVAWPQIVHAVVGLGVVLDNAVANKAFAPRLVGIWRVG